MQFNYDTEKPQVLSMGWGVQTFAMLILIEKGILPKPDLIIHADTMAEKPETIAFKNEVGIPLIHKLGIQYIETVQDNGLIQGYKEKETIPVVYNRSCTTNYKVRPVLKTLKEIYEPKTEEERRNKPWFQTWIGISTDEASRKIARKDQTPMYQEMIYPFLDIDLSRRQLIEIIEKSQYQLPIKSGCFLCPFMGLRGFLELKQKHPDLFDIAVEMEQDMFKKFPERRNGFIASSETSLKTIKEMKSLFSYTEIENDQRECDSGGCFL